MIKSFKLKIYPNKGKFSKLNNLIEFWKIEVQNKIDILWELDILCGQYCPSEFARGGRLVRDASDKAYNMVKVAKKMNQGKPIFKGADIDINSAGIRFMDNITKLYDFWVKITHLENNKRLVLPCKKTNIFNNALRIGILKKSAKILKIKDNFYLQVFVEIPSKVKNINSLLGVDVGLNNSVATSDGNFYGDDIKNLRINTKHRKYVGLSASKQALNRVANELISIYSNTVFVVEDLLFKGKRKRSKEFRRRNNNWAYGWLSRRLDFHGKLEGFQVIRVNPAYTSQTCPSCRSINKANRVGEIFKCIQCGYSNHADTVGAINILGRVAVERASHEYAKNDNA